MQSGFAQICERVATVGASMIVLTFGPATLARLMRRERASQHLAPGQVHGHQDQGDQAKAAAEAEGRIHPPGL